MRRSLRRLFLLTVIASVALAPMQAAGQSVIGDGAAYQLAISLWFDREDGQKVAYIALASRGSVAKLGRISDIAPEDVTGLGGVGRGVCRQRRHEVVCNIKLKAHELDFTTFLFDPTMGSASMTIAEEGHEILWTGRGPGSDPEYGVGGSTNWGNAYLTFLRKASIEGRAFGRRFEKQSPSFSYLLQGADAFAVATKRIHVGFDDGRFVVKVRVPLR